MKYLAFSLLLIASASAIDVQFKDCGSVLGKVGAVSVSPCEASPCQVKQNTNYTIGITFTPDAASQHIKTLIYGVVDGIPVPFPYDHPDACQDSGLKCPLVSGQVAKYAATLPIKSEYPAIRLVVKWELQDTDKKQDLVCVEMPIEVVKGYSNDRQKAVNRHWFED